MSKTEIKLYTRLERVARQYEQDEKAQRETGTGKTPGSNRNGSGAVSGGKSGGDIPDD